MKCATSFICSLNITPSLSNSGSLLLQFAPRAQHCRSCAQRSQSWSTTTSSWSRSARKLSIRGLRAHKKFQMDFLPLRMAVVSLLHVRSFCCSTGAPVLNLLSRLDESLTVRVDYDIDLAHRLKGDISQLLGQDISSHPCHEICQKVTQIMLRLSIQ